MFGIKSRLIRNTVSLNDVKSQKNRINLEWWKRRDNLGDTLATPIYEKMLADNGLDKDKAVKGTIHLMTVGSLIGLGAFDAVVWGSGIHKYGNIDALVRQKKYRKYDVRAVRGPITEFFLKGAGYDCPKVYGDPAVLMPEIYQPGVRDKKYKVSLICHIDRREQHQNGDIHFIDIETADYRSFIDEITASEKIISSSLHGIILSESYGIPTVFFNDRMDQEIIKFYDWYYSTGRYSVMMASSVAEAVAMDTMKLPDLSGMRKGLKDTFPVDLWK